MIGALRIQIPRVLIALYEIRNNRGVGHVGGDVDPNHMDALIVLGMSKWIIGELIRMFHGISTTEATATVELLSERSIPVIWKTGTNNRVLSPDLSKKDQALLVIYSDSDKISSDKLCDDVEYSNKSLFKKNVLMPLHKGRLIDYDSKSKLIQISPLGIKYVEEKLPLHI